MVVVVVVVVVVGVVAVVVGGGVVGGGVVVVVVCGGGVYLPIVIVTLEPLPAVVPALGDWSITMPSSFGLFTALVFLLTEKPAADRVLVAAGSVKPITLGTCEVVGAVPTTIVTALPAGAFVGGDGLWERTVPTCPGLLVT